MPVFYNENNPYAAQWLRNLIAKGHLPDGKVDARSILDLRPSDADAGQCHFFAGIGGWPLALDLAGWPRDREVWTASLPCQPFSVAGKGKGHADERHLWPTFHALVLERRPAVIFGEQVASSAGRSWIAAIRADLEEAGYAFAAAMLPACSVGAPHRRYRFFWVAHRLVEGREGRLSGRSDEERRDLDRYLGRDGAADLLADAESGGPHDAGSSARHGYMIKGHSGTTLTDAANLADWPTPTAVNRVRDAETMAKCAAFRKSNANQNTVPLYLGEVARLATWPTAWASDGEKNVRTLKGSLAEIARKGSPQDLAQAAALGVIPNGSTAATKNGGQLSPMFSLWLMGLPFSWVLAAPLKASRGRKC